MSMYKTGHRTVSAQEYWDQEFNIKTFTVHENFYPNVKRLMEQYNCNSMLEVGCAFAQGNQIIPNYLGMDFSKTMFNQSIHDTLLYGDITNKSLPLPDKCFDVVVSRYTLLHIPPSNIDAAVYNIQRLAKNLVVLCEYPSFPEGTVLYEHCFIHDLKEKFNGSNVLFIDGKGEQNPLMWKLPA